MKELFYPQRELASAERKAWNRELFKIYSRMREAGKNGQYNVEIGGVELIVLPEVYAPNFFTDTLWFANQVRDIVGRKSLLEIGTGSGAIAVFCAKNGANVTATDINDAAVENTRLNAKKHNLNIEVRKGNLYESLKKDEKFDYIFWAHPFNNWDRPVNNMLLRSGMDHRYESLKGYIGGAKDHLQKGGHLLLGTGDTADLMSINQFAETYGYNVNVLRSTTMRLSNKGNPEITDLLCEFK